MSLADPHHAPTTEAVPSRTGTALRRTVGARAISAVAAAAAVTVALPLTAFAQSSIPPLPSGSSGGSLNTDSLGSLAPERPLPPGPEVSVETVADGYSIPWDVVRDPEGVVITGERGSGTLHAIHPNGERSTIETGLDVYGVGESGLMGLALAHDFETSREIYTCHSQGGDVMDNRITAWQATEDWSRLESPRVLVDGIPLNETGRHSGCRILPLDDGTLLIATGDAATGTAPQDLGSLSGKVLHITRTGEPASDAGIEGLPADSPILTYGHRNVQGLALRPGTTQIFAAEHGPDVDDEVNLVIPGGNYGWNPVGAGGRYNENVPMTDLRAYPDAVEASWRSGAPTLAPGGAAFLDDPAWGEWDGALAVSMLKTSQIVLMKLSEDGRSVTEKATILRGDYGRLRSVTAEPGGSLLVTTSNGGGNDEVLRVSPTTAGHDQSRSTARAASANATA